jgi:putative hemolysin
MSNVGIQFLVLLLLLVANGVFAAAELSIASSRKVRLQQRAEGGDAGAQAALDLANEPGRFLSTVQIGITLISILTGAFGGSSLGAFIGGTLGQVPFLAPISEQLGVFLAILVITYLSLIIGELVPKQLALGNPEAIAARVAGPMGRLSVFASPAVWLLSRSTALILRLLGSKPSTEPAVTEEEITILVQQGAQAGVFQAAEREIVDRVFRLGDQRVVDLMVPRPRVTWIDITVPAEENLRRMAQGGYAHYPVCRGDLDHVLGIVSVRDLWARQVAGQSADIESALHPPLYLPETVAAYKALEQFKTSGQWIALVLDEYGGIEGLITLGDLLGDLVGDGVPPVDAAGAVRRDDGSWLVDGMLPLDELRDFVPVSELPGEELGYFQTLGGFVLAQLGHLPAAGDRVTWDGYDFEVLDMDGQRVDKVLVQEMATPTQEAAQ